MPHLFFTQNLKPSNSIIYGLLSLVYDDNTKIDYIACSGAIGRQHKDLLWKAGQYGAIPPGEYWIPTTGYHSNLPGINGLFYHIQPDPVSSLGSRSELGIHWDGGVIGTAGCIGIKNKGSFSTFCKRLSAIAQEGVKRLDLSVSYPSLN